MIGVIVTGHGGFAGGMKANVKMLAGAEAELEAIDFGEDTTPEQLDAALEVAFAHYSACPYTLVLCDIAGGTPFNRASTLSVARPNVRVLSGLNASMLMDLVMRNIVGDEPEDIDALAAELMQTGHENIRQFALTPAPVQEETEDGI